MEGPVNEYHKIQTLYLRDPETNHKTLLEGQFAKPAFEYLADREWVFTEKVDGTNIRVGWDGETVAFGGRTDRAQIPAFLVAHLMDRFTADALAGAFDCGGVTLYGEGYGARIQKGGGRYLRDSVGFVLFDVQVGGWWLERENVEDIAGKLDIPVVPIIGRGTVFDAVDAVRAGFVSTLATDTTLTAEGIVLRPAVELHDRRGDRIISKLKHRDFA